MSDSLDLPVGRRPLPARSDWRAALDVYVAGRNRALTLDEKRRLASRGDAPSEPGGPRTEAADPGEPSYGVGVPERLDYYRNAGTWRNQLPGGGSRDGGPVRS